MPDALARFVPKFDTLFFSVNETEAADLKETDIPLGWLITVLQQKNADIETISNALFEAVPHVKHLHKAIVYLVLFILHQRPAVEHEDLIRLVEQQAHDMEIDNMAQSIIEISKEKGRKEGREEGETKGETRTKREVIIKLLQIKFDNVPESITKKINGIQNLSRLNSLFEKAATIDTLEDFDE